MVDPEQSTASPIAVLILAMAPPKEKESMLKETTSVGSTNASLEENGSSPASISQFLGVILANYIPSFSNWRSGSGAKEKRVNAASDDLWRFN